MKYQCLQNDENTKGRTSARANERAKKEVIRIEMDFSRMQWLYKWAEKWLCILECSVWERERERAEMPFRHMILEVWIDMTTAQQECIDLLEVYVCITGSQLISIKSNIFNQIALGSYQANTSIYHKMSIQTQRRISFFTFEIHLIASHLIWKMRRHMICQYMKMKCN